MKLINRKKIFTLIFISFIFIFTACVSQKPEITLPDSSKTSEITPTIFSSTITATPTELSQPKKLILLNNEENKSGEMLSISNNLSDYAQSNELIFEIANTYNSDLFKSAKLVVLINPEDSWVEESSNLIDTIFIIISDKTLDLAENAFQIKTLPAEYYFLVGYVSAVASDDWRVGALLSEKFINNVPTSELFSNGMHFLCGLCFPIYTPLVSFPVTANLGIPEDDSTNLAKYGELSSNRPNTIFIDSTYLTEGFFTTLKNDGMTIISNQTGNPESGVIPDIIIYQEISDILSDLLISLDNNSPKISNADFKIESNSGILTTGKLNFINIIINDLRQGFIYPSAIQD